MLEFMLSMEHKGSSGLTFPNSGPGPITLIKGTAQVGYFGEVSSAELMSYSAWRSLLVSTPGTAWRLNTNDLGWFKFIFKGKVLFVAKTWTFENTTWQAVYQAGGIYGVNNNGLYPSGTPVNQYKPYVFQGAGKQWTLIPRVMKLSATDPMATTDSPIGGELYELLGRCSSDPVFPSSGQFASYARVDIGLNKVHMGGTTLGTNTARTPVMGYPSGTGWNSLGTSLTKVDASGYGQAFRAVLEVEGDPTTPV